MRGQRVKRNALTRDVARQRPLSNMATPETSRRRPLPVFFEELRIDCKLVLVVFEPLLAVFAE